MAWSDAARAAALEARRRHASFSGKKSRAQAWYHGGPTALRGATIEKSHTVDVKGKQVRVAFATSSIKQAMVYAAQSTINKGGSVYKVEPRSGKNILHRDSIGKAVLHLGARSGLRVIERLPMIFTRQSKAFVKSSRVPVHKRVRGI